MPTRDKKQFIKLIECGILLLMLWFPCVDAQKQESIATEMQYSQLKFNDSQEISFRSKGFSLLKNAENTQIPEGATIHHSAQGRTRVFDSFGNQLLISNDSTSKKILTTIGYVPATRMYQIPSGSFIQDEGNQTRVYQDNKMILTVIDETIKEENAIKSSPFSQKLNTDASGRIGWAATEYAIKYNIPDLAFFSAEWKVPTPPPAPTLSDSHTFLWNGVGEKGAIVQPVISTGTDGIWKGFAVYGNNKTNPPEYFWTPGFIVKPNDDIQGLLEWDITSHHWAIYIWDKTTDQIGENLSVEAPELDTTNLNAMIELEQYNVTSHSDLPATTIFNKIIFENTSFNPISIIWDEKVVDLDAATLLQGLYVDAPNQSQVTLYTDKTFTITPTAGIGGNTSPKYPVSVLSGSDYNVTITPDNPPYTIGFVLVDGESVGRPTVYPFEDIKADHSIDVTFVKFFKISTEVGSGGATLPPSDVNVQPGGSQTFTIIPNTGYEINDVNVSGVSQGAISTYTFTDVQKDETINVTFKPILPSTHANFTASPRSNFNGAPLKVQFTDRSTNVPNEWLWNFGDGDGTNATKKHPIHTYTKNGTFTVTLTATNRSTGSSGFTRTGYITVGPLYAETFRPYMVLIFNRTGSTKWLPPAGVMKVDYLVVAGGGEGGNGIFANPMYYSGGGGGGGGVLSGNGIAVSGIQTIVVGAGGSGTAGSTPTGANGGNSSFGTVTAIGGGGGGGYISYGGNGGSGGGGSGFPTTGGSGIGGQGYAGGGGSSTLPGYPGGGGGGASEAGTTPTDSAIGGRGGNGTLINFTGSPDYYGSGGGGGIGSYDAFGSGGAGCGADGSRGTANPAKCQGTGAGGGGAGGTQTHGAGGSGTVIIRYQTPETMSLAANFSAATDDPDSLTVIFTDLSTGSPTSWFWDFGDGDNINSTVRNPIHQYSARGSYTASLTALNADETDIMTKSRYITVDMRDKIGVFRNYSSGIHAFYLDNNGNGTWITSEDIQFPNFCNYKNISISGDWDGDGRTEIGAFRNSTGGTIWLLDLDGDGTLDADEGPFNFLTGDFPVTGDWNGDGKAEIGIFRNSTQRFLLDYSGDRVWQESEDRRINFSSTYNDMPVSGDWNNDGISEIGIFRNSTHSWYLNLDGDEIQDPDEGPFVYTSNSEDIPITGDWNSDGITEMGIFRPSKGRFLLDYDNDRIYDSGDINTVFVVGNYSVSGRW